MDSIQDWKKAVLANTEDPDQVQAAEALALLLSGEADANDTARSITMTFEVDLKRNNGSTYADGHNKFYCFCMNHMCNAIVRLGSTVVHQRLIELLKEISKQPNVKTPDGSVKMHEGCEAYWRDVPGWEYSFAEEILCKSLPCIVYNTLLTAVFSDYDRPGQYPLERKDDFLGQASCLLNGTRFAAVLLERGEFFGGLPRYASDFLRMGIEQDYDDRSELSAKAYEYEVLIPAAATWLTIAGKAIYSHCLNDEVEDLQADVQAQAGWGGGSWTMQRWDLWKAQLEGFSRRDDFNDECRAIATQALQKMLEAEAGHTS